MSYHNLEAERSVLGSILLKPELVHETSLTGDEFSSETHRALFGAMLSLRDNNQPVDIVHMAQEMGSELERHGGVGYLLNLSNTVPATSAFGEYEKIVKEKHVLRTGMNLLRQVMTSEYSDPKTFAAEIMGIAETVEVGSNTSDDFIHISKDIINHYDALCDKASQGKGLGHSTICGDMDKLLGKWQKQTLNIIAARPSMGKTAYLLCNALANAKQGDTVAIFSLEMSRFLLYDRMLAAECMIDGLRIKNATLQEDEWEKYTLGLGRLGELDIYIDESNAKTIHEIRSQVRKLKKQHENLIVYIDYLQLINGGSKFNSRSRNEEVGYISGMLKQMARENDCPVIALAQLSRSLESRQDKRPMMSDLRESGNIEQDADTITFLYRDDYYNRESESKNVIELIITKNRNGQVGTVEMVNLKQYCKFVPYHEVNA